MAQKIETGTRPRQAFDALFERAKGFLANPWNIWASGDFAMRRLVLRLAFAGRIPYLRGEGFSNAKFALSFNILKEIDMKEQSDGAP